MKKTVFTCSLLFAAFIIFSFTGGEDEIISAMKTGNAKALATHFKTTIDLTVLNKESVSSKAQAEQILKDFFAKHPPKSFKIVHQGTSKLGIQYRIGTLETTNGSFRVTINSRSKNGKELIEQFRIDSD
ncbi:MAG: DUF4783 domain-containing protein [Flavobacteriales bacterium]